jgi:NAD(P)-dependent dehydrogenase (short-subunit alcohol dehydrogenase family)
MIETGLAGKRALVTGGASGIGRAIALALKDEGVAVAIVDRNPVGETTADVRLTVELGDERASVEAVGEAAAALGGLDLLVSAAAIARHEPTTRLTSEAWAKTLASNLTACAWTSREASRRMIASGGGAILVIGSTSLYTPLAGEAAYRASKAGLKAYVEVLALELAPFSIRVNLLTPGAFHTPLTESMTEERRAQLLREIPLAREGAPGELCATALLLLSDRLSPYTIGAEFVVDGGLSLRPLPFYDADALRRLSTTTGATDRLPGRR